MKKKKISHIHDILRRKPMKFTNSYEDTKRAEAYSKLQFAGTYYLAYRDLPELIKTYVHGNNALDFGCGTGRSTRFLTQLGLQTLGIDISKEMVQRATKLDPTGEYHVIHDGDFNRLSLQSYDLVLSAFTFDNIPTLEKKVALFTGLAGLMKKTGILINLVSSPDIYTHEWTSFSTKDFPKNKKAKAGDVVQIMTTDFEDSRPCYDIFWPDADYQHVYQQANLTVVKIHRPLATGTEPYHWVNETRIAPWVIYVLKKTEKRKS
jgi:ubiquinone/menaquinone biosynthesis C-methylase UbiE